MYEVLVDLQQAAAVASSEPQQVHTHTQIYHHQGVNMFFKIILVHCYSQEEMEDADNPMEEESSLSCPPVSEAELDRLAGVLEELHHLLETAPNSMVQPPGKAFPTSARITGPQERDDPYPTLYRYTFKHTTSETVQKLIFKVKCSCSLLICNDALSPF